METLHLGEFFLNRQVPFVAMRAVLDSHQDDIPILESTREGEKWPGPLHILRYLISHREGLIDFWRLYQNGRRARDVLGRSVAAILRVWLCGVK
jgi:hypothetical protein